MTFRRAYFQYPVCGPSRTSFLHGLYPQSAGILENKSEIHEVQPGKALMLRRFRESGYWTGAVGKVFHDFGANPGEVASYEVLLVTPIRETFEAEYGVIDQGNARQIASWL